eukprot:COSAG04_NODE_512_length_13248_cov_51.630314_22_plen_62_part_00
MWRLLGDAQRWRDVPKPTIAMVHGFCIYHAWAIASACDLVCPTPALLYRVAVCSQRWLHPL